MIQALFSNIYIKHEKLNLPSRECHRVSAFGQDPLQNLNTQVVQPLRSSKRLR